jgi:secondary thiamine-phosphate synthase enzyme
MIDITAAVAGWCADQAMGQGLLTLLCQHTSASLTVQENADPDVQRDLARGIDRLAPRDFPWRHVDEGPDDMPAHLRTVLSGVHLSVPLIGGRLALGTWQGIYLWEHRDRPHDRRVAMHLIGA